jgi:hypothetical protein
VIHAKSVKKSLEVELLVGLSFVEMLLIEFTKGSADVGLKILRCLISNLQGVLQDGLWNDLHVWKGWWLRGDEASEIWMRSFFQHNF